jgi:hypothetical protein
MPGKDLQDGVLEQRDNVLVGNVEPQGGLQPVRPGG